MKLRRKTVFKRKFHLCLSPDSTGRGAERNLLSRFGAGEGGVGHGEVGWVGVCPIPQQADHCRSGSLDHFDSPD
jgi:hypothetical protein